MTDSHIEKQLTQMMLDRAARETAAGNLDAATALMRSVILGYPDHPSRDTDRHHHIQAFLRGDPPASDRYETATALFDLAELRLATITLENTDILTRADIAKTIDIAVVKAAIPRLAFAADAIVERHNDGSLLDTRRAGSALTFGGSAPSKALVDIIKACFAVAGWLKAHPTLIFLVLVAGDSAAKHMEDLLSRIAVAETTDSYLCDAINNLGVASRRESGQAPISPKQTLAEALLSIPTEIHGHSPEKN